ncbi:GNAT family acetyltransferase [Ammonicoccus fulvus]|uniref:GNAT family acetyltransferase n=1 Tax=Ammonicoccus fulvus TaxID=3138240 RepID=A0ABZ3FVY0_9ACTN
MVIEELGRDDRSCAEAVALWRACGLTRPWNDPMPDLVRALEGPSSTVLVARDRAAGEAQVTGTVMVGHDGHRGWVYYLAVAPDRRGHGLGRELMAAAETWLAERGVPKIQLMIRAGNASVRAFYEALGYADQEVIVMGRSFDQSLNAARSAGN